VQHWFKGRSTRGKKTDDDDDVRTHTHTSVHACISWIHKFVMATIGCVISHKNTKHMDKCSNNKTEKQRKKMTKPQTNTFSKYCKDNTKKFDVRYTHIIQGTYNKQ
jgi:hypothetical protein